MNNSTKLWPYNNSTAFLMVPLIWLLLAFLASLSQQTLNWPETESKKLVTQVIIAAGCVPLLLVLVDFLASRGAIFSYKDFKIDFSQFSLDRAELRRDAIGLPANIGVEGAIVTDSSPMNIIEALEHATGHEIAIIDLQDGDAWWVTRLLALAGGAVRTQTPRLFVFVGRLENQEYRFIGWAYAKDVLAAILNSKEEYRRRFLRAQRIAEQVRVFDAGEFLPFAGGGTVSLHHDIARFTNDPQYHDLGPAITGQIVMDQLGSLPSGGSLEQPPDRLTVGRLNDLFGHCLYRTEIDLDSPKDQQITRLLESREPYLGLVRGRRFESMLRREDGERLVVRELYAQLQQGTKAK